MYNHCMFCGTDKFVLRHGKYGWFGKCEECHGETKRFPTKEETIAFIEKLPTHGAFKDILDGRYIIGGPILSDNGVDSDNLSLFDKHIKSGKKRAKNRHESNMKKIQKKAKHKAKSKDKKEKGKKDKNKKKSKK